MLEESIRKWNPWWADVKLISELSGIRRSITEKITTTMTLLHIKDIIGVRRSGKTTTMYQIIDTLFNQKINPQNILFINFDDPDINATSSEQLEKTIEQLNPHISHVFFDEIQQKKEWERWVRTLYDTKKYQQLFISGSSASLLTKDVGCVLSGRHITFIVYPFSFKEYLLFVNWEKFTPDYLEYKKNTLLHHLNTYIQGGGYPEVIGKNDFQRKLILTNIYNDIISRDIASRYNASYEITQKISYYLMSNIGKEFSFRSIAHATGLSIETIEKYLNFLKESFLIFTLDVFSYKTKIQFKQNKKVYSIDTGLRNAVSFKFSEDYGRLSENLVFIELKRREKNVYYWKNNKAEVDFIVTEGNKPNDLIQVCWDTSNEKTKKREINSLVDGLQTFNLQKGFIITKDYENQETVDKKTIEFVPLWKWLLRE